jgi:hypothetical protein
MKRPMYFAGLSAIILVIISIFNLVFGFALGLAGAQKVLVTVINLIFSIAALVFAAFFYWGFIVMGKKFKGKLLQVMAWIGFVMIILAFIFSFFIGIISLFSQSVSASELTSFASSAFNETAGFQEFFQGSAVNLLIIFLMIFIFLVLIMSAYTILWGVGILKLQHKLDYARTTGILNIVAGATYIILIGFLIHIVAYIFEILLLFEASKKVER